jgi:hypothetical protein
MSDNLEKFIKENRSEFDDRQAPKNIWLAIDQNLDQKSKKSARRISLWRYTRAAAAAVILISAGVFIGRNMDNQTSKAVAFEELFPEYFEAEQYYQKEVNAKVAQLANYNHDAGISEDLKQLDKNYEELQKELAEAPREKQEQIINAMITNYRTKLSILERVLERIQSTNQENLKTKKDDSIEI